MYATVTLISQYICKRTYFVEDSQVCQSPTPRHHFLLGDGGTEDRSDIRIRGATNKIFKYKT